MLPGKLAARVAAAVTAYRFDFAPSTDEIPAGYTLVQRWVDNARGLSVAAYRAEAGDVIIAFGSIFLPSQIGVDRYGYQAFTSRRDDLRQFVAGLPEGARVALVGHALGGAIASYAAYDLLASQTIDASLLSLTTFNGLGGRMGLQQNGGFDASVVQALDARHYRKRSDLVTRLASQVGGQTYLLDPNAAAENVIDAGSITAIQALIAGGAPLDNVAAVSLLPLEAAILDPQSALAAEQRASLEENIFAGFLADPTTERIDRFSRDQLLIGGLFPSVGAGGPLGGAGGPGGTGTGGGSGSGGGSGGSGSPGGGSGSPGGGGGPAGGGSAGGGFGSGGGAGANTASASGLFGAVGALLPGVVGAFGDAVFAAGILGGGPALFALGILAGLAAEALEEGRPPTDGEALTEYLTEVLKEYLAEELPKPLQIAKTILEIIERFHTPLVLDLDGDGIETTALRTRPAFFDYAADGTAELTGWVSADDGFLAWDRNENGRIDNLGELFGGLVDFDVAAFRALDANSDGVIDAADPAFANLRVFRDFDQNGFGVGSEITSLAANGVSALSTAFTNVNEPNQGNVVSLRGTYRTTAGETRALCDVLFAIDPTTTIYTGPPPSPDLLLLPQLPGGGSLPPLAVAMGQDPALRAMVEALRGLSVGDLTAFQTQVQNILYRWAKVENVDPASRGPYLDARQLGVVEAFFGARFKPNGTHILEKVGEGVQRAYYKVFLQQSAALLAQTPAGIALGLEYNPAFELTFFTGNPIDLFAQIAEFAPSDPEASAAYFAARIGFFDTLVPKDVRLLIDAVRRARAENRTPSLPGLLDVPANVDALRSTLRGQSLDLHLQALQNPVFTIQFTSYAVTGFRNIVQQGPTGTGSVFVTDSSMFIDFGGLNKFYSGSGADLLYGLEGNDDLHGGLDADRIYGGADDDNLYGDEGDDGVFGGEGNDTLRGGDGFDRLQGEAGDDVVHGGDGNDDLFGGPGADELHGNGGNDNLTGGPGDDHLLGEAGSDEYLFEMGHGKDLISETDINGASDTIRFGAGITPDSISLERRGSDLCFVPQSATDMITVKNFFLGSVYTVERVVFADGTVWDDAYLRNNLARIGTDNADTMYGSGIGDRFYGLGGNDVLWGYAGDDTFVGGPGNDTLRGGAGGDRYLYAPGDGYDEIMEEADAAPDRIVFGAGITAADVMIEKQGLDLRVRVGADPAQGLVVRNYFLGTSGGSKVELIDFADGTRWTTAQIEANLVSMGTEGNDTLNGTAGSDIMRGLGGNDSITGQAGDDQIVGGPGDDSLAGFGGNDTYFFAPGDGRDVINVGNYNAGGADRLMFTAGIEPAHVAIQRSSTHLILVVQAGVADVKFTNWFLGTNNQLAEVVFADGTRWSAAHINANAIRVALTSEDEGARE